jgi:hypothetical protein
VNITSPNVNNGYFGTSFISGVDYVNIDRIIGNADFDNRITVPNIMGKDFTVVYTGYRQGYIGDPIYFENFIVNGGIQSFFTPSTPTTTPSTPTSPYLGPIAPIVDQPSENGNNNDGYITTPSWETIDNTSILDITIETLDKMTKSGVKASTSCTSINGASTSGGLLNDKPTEEELLNALKYKMTKSVKESAKKSLTMNSK